MKTQLSISEVEVVMNELRVQWDEMNKQHAGDAVRKAQLGIRWNGISLTLRRVLVLPFEAHELDELTVDLLAMRALPTSNTVALPARPF